MRRACWTLNLATEPYFFREIELDSARANLIPQLHALATGRTRAALFAKSLRIRSLHPGSWSVSGVDKEDEMKELLEPAISSLKEVRTVQCVSTSILRLS